MVCTLQLGEKEGRTSRDELVLEADVERGVRVGCKGHSRFAHDVFGPSILVANCVFDLAGCQQIREARLLYQF